MEGLQWCRNRLLVPGNPLAASLLFVDPVEHDRILALRALITELAALDDPSAEPMVRAAKFGWWRQALIEGAPHPVLQAMAGTGASRQVQLDMLLPLLAAIASSSDNLRFERQEELWDHCLSIGGEAARLELRLDGPGDPHESRARALGAAGYLVRLVRDLAVDARQNRWLVPLDLQAQFQVARGDALDIRGGPGWDGLVRTLLARALREGQAAASALPAGNRHLHIHWSLDQRLASRLARRPDAILRRRILPGHAGNVWTAWRAARRLSRSLKD